MTKGDTSKQYELTERLAALNRVGTALMSELDESRLLHMIAETALNLTNASFAAFTLRPINTDGYPVVPSEGYLFYLAAVVGVSKEQEELFGRMSLGGEGLLAPIFRKGVPVLIDDAVHYVHQASQDSPQESRRDATFAFSHGGMSPEEIKTGVLPRGHPIVRSFLGVPLLDREKQVRGGLLLGHDQPGRFTQEDQTLLVGLASQAAVALENARLYRMTQMRAQELNAIFESIADGVMLVNEQGHIQRENSKAQSLRELITASPERRRELEEFLQTTAQRVLRGEKAPERSMSITDSAREVRDYILSASPLRMPENASGPLSSNKIDLLSVVTEGGEVVVTWHDVTEARRLLIERRTHAETEARRALLQIILDELPSSVYLVRGMDARLVLANRASATVWGATWPVGQPMLDFLREHKIRIDRVDGSELTIEQYATLRAVQKREMVFQHQEVIRHADGTSLPVLVNAAALDARELNLSPADAHACSPDGSESAAIVVHQDVTALKDAEHLKDEFIGIAAHELRNPLAVLKGFAQTLLVQTARGKGAELDEWQLEALQGIDQSSLRMVELIDDLLDVTRLQAGRLSLHIEPTDIIALTRRVITRLQITTEKHRLVLTTPLDYLVTLVDAHRIEQVLSNLLGNAIKYSPEGGSVAVTIQETPISGDAGQKNEALICVSDHGIGIPGDQQARLFGRFVRADNARMYGIGGTGLGLYLSRELVERHGGHIWFSSTEGQGSNFYITLPLLQEEESEEYLAEDVLN